MVPSRTQLFRWSRTTGLLLALLWSAGCLGDPAGVTFNPVDDTDVIAHERDVQVDLDVSRDTTVTDTQLPDTSLPDTSLPDTSLVDTSDAVDISDASPEPDAIEDVVDDIEDDADVVIPPQCFEDSNCGDALCGSWSGCEAGQDVCSETGTKFRTCYPQVCQNGICTQGVADIEFETCTRTTTGDSCTGTDACSIYSCAEGTCKGTTRCLGTTQSCGCQSCHRCPASGWYVKASNVPCCNGTGQTCLCDEEEYRQYACESHDCQYTVSSTRLVNHGGCSTCANETTTTSCDRGLELLACGGTLIRTTHVRSCSETTKSCERTGQFSSTQEVCTMPNGTSCTHCENNGTLCQQGTCNHGTCEPGGQTCQQNATCQTNEDCFGGQCQFMLGCVCHM